MGGGSRSRAQSTELFVTLIKHTCKQAYGRAQGLGAAHPQQGLSTSSRGSWQRLAPLLTGMPALACCGSCVFLLQTPSSLWQEQPALLVPRYNSWPLVLNKRVGSGCAGPGCCRSGSASLLCQSQTLAARSQLYFQDSDGNDGQQHLAGPKLQAGALWGATGAGGSEEMWQRNDPSATSMHRRQKLVGVESREEIAALCSDRAGESPPDTSGEQLTSPTPWCVGQSRGSQGTVVAVPSHRPLRLCRLSLAQHPSILRSAWRLRERRAHRAPALCLFCSGCAIVPDARQQGGLRESVLCNAAQLRLPVH